MSMQTGDHHVDEVVQGLISGFQQVLRQARGLVNRFRQRLNRQQRTRMMMEHWARQGQWDPNVNAQRQQQTGPERTQDAELAARLTEERDALQANVNARDARIRDLQQQADQARQGEAAADAQQRAADERHNQVDGNDNGIDDNVDADNRLAQQNQNEQDLQTAERREDQQRQEADDREKREEQDRKGREEGETGVGPGEAAGAAAGAAVTAEAIDEELDRQDEAANAAENAAGDEAENAAGNEAGDAENLRQAEADNEQGTDANATNDAERDQATDPAINPDQQAGAEEQAGAEAENAAADPTQNADQQLDQEATGEPDPHVTDTSLDGQEAANTDVENAAPGVDEQTEVENAGAEPSQADPQTHIEGSEAEQNTGYQQGEGDVASLHYGDGNAQDARGTDMEDAGQGTEAGEQQSVGEIRNSTFVVNQNGINGAEQGQDDQQADGQQPDGQQLDGQQLDGQQVDGQQVNGQQVDGQQVDGQQVDGQQVDGQQAEQGREPQETLDQPAFPTAGDAAAANRVEQQSMEQTGQDGQGGQDAQRADQVAARDAQEKPVLDGLRAENAASRAQQSQGPSQMSTDEIGAQQHRTGAGLEHASGSPGYDGGASTPNDRPGTAAQQRTEDRNRGASRSNEGHGMGE